MIGIYVFAVVAAMLISGVKVMREYERAVVLRLGRLVGHRGPGLIYVIPGIEKMLRIDMRTITMDVPSQDVITRDNVSVKVNAVVYFRVMSPVRSIIEIENYIYATSQLAQTTLRSMLGEVVLDDLLAEREKLNQRLQEVIDRHTDPWGVKVALVEVKQVDLPESMQRAMARQAEAEREKRAKVIHAEGEFLASQRLADAAAVIQMQPAALQLRYLQTLTEIATEKNSTIIFPLPIDTIKMFLEKVHEGK